GDGDAGVALVHVVGVDDALVGDDVLVGGLEGEDGAARGTAAVELAAAHAEVERGLGRSPFFGTGEPAAFDGGVGPGGEDTDGCGVVGALDRESVVDDGAFGHGLLSGFGSSGCSARTSPRRSRRR